MVQRKAERAARDAGRVAIPEGGGAELPGDVRERMSGALGAPLPSVKIHTGAASGEAARKLGARAFTDGVSGDVHFAPGQYAPGTREGDRLLAHELAHVAQASRGGGEVHRKATTDGAEAEDLDVSQPGDPAELEADAAADHAADRLHGRPRAGGGAPRLSASLSGVGRKLHLAPEGGESAPQGAQPAPGATPDAGQAAGPQSPQAAPGSGGAAPPGGDQAQQYVDAWPQVKAALAAGQVPQVNQLPPTAGNAAGVRRLQEVHSDENLPPEVRAQFLAELGQRIAAMEEPIKDLHAEMKDVTFKNPDAFLRKGKKMPSADYVKNEMGGLRRALSLKWLVANATPDFYRRASELDPRIPPKVEKDAAWGVAGLIVPLVKSGQLQFDAMGDVNGGAVIGDYPPGASGWFFAAKDIPEGLPPPDLRVQIAGAPEYGDGYQVAELPPDMAMPNDKGEGGASRPTALDLCLAPEGKLNPDQAEPAGRTDPAALKPGQADAREVVMPPLPLSSTKRGPLVLA